MVQKLKRVRRELVKKGVIVNMYTDTMEMPDGRVAEWDYIEHKKGAAAVLAVLPDGKILMVRPECLRSGYTGDSGGSKGQCNGRYGSMCETRAGRRDRVSMQKTGKTLIFKINGSVLQRVY